jgi:hypothetical protein
MWWIILGVIFVAVAAYLMAKVDKGHIKVEENYLPEEWNERLIARQLLRLQDRPPALSHYLSSVLDRFVLRQDSHTARIRTEFLNTELQQLKVVKEFQASIDSKSLESDIARRTLELQREDLEHRRQRQIELDDLTHELEKQKLIRQIDELRNPQTAPPPPPPQPGPTPEQERQRNRDEIYERMSRRKQEKEQALVGITRGRHFEDLSDQEQNQYKAVENQYQDLYERDMEEVKKYL